MSEICPRRVRGTLVSGYQFCITIGLLLASCVTYATDKRNTAASYRIPIGIQFAWAVILATGLFFLPESPRYFVKRGRIEDARNVLARLRGQPADSEYIELELSEIVANADYERQLIPAGGYMSSWLHCFSGSLWKSNSNLRKTILGTSLQMMQQWTGVNFIFYFSTPFLQSTGAISNSFLISLIFTLVNVCSTPISFYTMEKVGRRPLLVWGALGMLICQFIVGIIGVTIGFNKTHLGADGASLANNISAVNAQVAFIAIFIFFCKFNPCLNLPTTLTFLTSRLHMGTRCMGGHWRDFPSPYPSARCCTFNCLQLALELHHHRHCKYGIPIHSATNSRGCLDPLHG